MVEAEIQQKRRAERAGRVILPVAGLLGLGAQPTQQGLLALGPPGQFPGSASASGGSGAKAASAGRSSSFIATSARSRMAAVSLSR